MIVLAVVTVAFAFLVIAALTIGNVVLRARLDGYQQGAQQASRASPPPPGGIGCIQILAVIGFVAICAMCVFAGVVFAR